MSNERAEQRMDDHSIPVVDTSIHVLPDYCLCGQPFCNCGHWEHDNHGSSAMRGSFNQRINNYEKDKF